MAMDRSRRAVLTGPDFQKGLRRVLGLCVRDEFITSSIIIFNYYSFSSLVISSSSSILVLCLLLTHDIILGVRLSAHATRTVMTNSSFGGPGHCHSSHSSLSLMRRRINTVLIRAHSLLHRHRHQNIHPLPSPLSHFSRLSLSKVVSPLISRCFTVCSNALAALLLLRLKPGIGSSPRSRKD